MTATILQLDSSQEGNTAEVSTVNLSQSVQTDIVSGDALKIRQKIISGLNNTNLDADVYFSAVGDAPVERIYPHVFDEDAASGQVRNHILKALENAQSALDSYSIPDFESMNTSLTVIAAIMSDAHLLTEFNESLGAVVSFLRRATLNTSSDEVNLPGLNVLVNVLQSMAANPMIDLDDACDLIDKLSTENWRGEHGVTDELVAILFGEIATENAELQTNLFDDIQTEVVQEDD